MAIHRAQTLRFGYGSVPQGYRSLAMLVGLLFTRVLPALSADEHGAGYQIVPRVIFTSKDKYACHNRSLVSLSG